MSSVFGRPAAPIFGPSEVMWQFRNTELVISES